MVANSGTALSDRQITLLHRFTENITLIYDGDTAGIKAAMRGTNMLLSHGMRVKILLLPDNEDPDSFARSHSASEFRQYIEEHQTDFITFKTSLLMHEVGNDPLKRSDLIKDIVATIANIPEEIVRATYAHRCSDMLHVDETMLLREIARLRKTQRQGNGITANTSQDTISQNQTIPEDSTKTKPATGMPDNIKTGSKFIGLERLIMEIIVKYGEQEFEITTDSGPQTFMVLDYVRQLLEVDGLQFRYQLYRDMLSEAVQASSLSDFNASSFFLNHPNETYSRTAVNLLSDKYETPQPNTENGTYLIHLMLDYKYAVVEDELRKIKQQLTDPQLLTDASRCNELITQHSKLTLVQRSIAKALGDRVII